MTAALTSTHPTRRILFGTTSSITARTFLRGQLGFLRSQGWTVQLVCGDGAGLVEFAGREGVRTNVVSTGRKPSPATDVAALLRLLKLVRRLSPAVTVMGTPKMGLFGTAAAWLVRVPRRVYLVHGLRFEGAQGTARQALRTAERIACSLATEVVAVSPSVRDVLVREKICAASRVVVLGSGSPNGFDEAAFRPADPASVEAARRRLDLPDDARVVGFVGRLTGDKGVQALVQMWQRMSPRRPDAWLVVVGAPEPASAADQAAIDWLAGAPRVRHVGPQEDVASVLAAIDLLVLPTRREGLPTVVLEAAAMTRPTVAYAVTGTVDVIHHEVTGLLVPFGHDLALSEAVERLVDDDGACRAMGAAAHDLVTERFPAPLVWRHWADYLAASRCAS